MLGVRFEAQAHSDEKEKALTTEVEKLKNKVDRFKELDVTDDTDLPEVEKPHKQPSLFIGPNGKVRILAGEIVSIASGDAATTMAVKVWGLTLTVDKGEAKIIPEGATLAVGNRVSVHGKMDMASGMVKAQKINSHTATDKKANDITAKIQELLAKLNKLRAEIGLPPIAL